MAAPSKMTVAELKVILSRYPDNEFVEVESSSPCRDSWSFFSVGDDTIMED